MKKSRLLIVTLLALILALTLTACKADNSSAYPDAAPDGGDKGSGIVTGGTLGVSPEEQLVIKTATETIETEQYDELVDYIRARVAELGGYIASSYYYDDSYNNRYNRNASIVVRIPADKFEDFVGDVGGFGTVTYFTENVEDVTLEYIDIDSRISVLEAEEIALNEILAKATTLDEILMVRESLKDVQAELASLRAQKTRLDNDIAYSTVSISIREVETVTPADEEKGFLAEIGERFLDSLGSVGNFFRGFFVWLIGDSPIILLVLGVAVGVFFLVRFLIRRKRAGKRDKTE